MPHQGTEALLRPQLLPQQAVLGGELEVVGHALQLQAQFVEVERFGDVVVGAKLHGLDGGLHRGKAGHHDGDRFRPPLLDLAQDLQTIAARQSQVEQNHIDVRRIQNAAGLIPRFRQLRAEAQRTSHVTAAFPYRSLIFHDQQVQQVSLLGLLADGNHLCCNHVTCLLTSHHRALVRWFSALVTIIPFWENAASAWVTINCEVG